MSALHQAVRGGDIEVVKLLLDAGADPKLRDGDGKTGELAGHASIVEVLDGFVPSS